MVNALDFILDLDSRPSQPVSEVRKGGNWPELAILSSLIQTGLVACNPTTANCTQCFPFLISYQVRICEESYTSAVLGGLPNSYLGSMLVTGCVTKEDDHLVITIPEHCTVWWSCYSRWSGWLWSPSWWWVDPHCRGSTAVLWCHNIRGEVSFKMPTRGSFWVLLLWYPQ